MTQDSSPDQRSALRWRTGIPVVVTDERIVYVGDHRVTMDLSPRDISRLNAIASHRSGAPNGPTDPRDRAMVDYLARVGALAPQAECWWLPPARRTAIQPHVLALSEWHREPQAAIAARSSWRIGIEGSGSLADAITSLLAPCGLTPREAEFGSDSADVFVVVGAHGIDAPEALLPQENSGPDYIGDHPHLPVSTYRARASVGPLVLPGRTPCLNCLHLHRRDGDPRWPAIVARWRDSRSTWANEADPLITWQAAITTVWMIRQWIDSAQQAPPHRIRWALPDSRPSIEEPTPHPSCGCRWAQRAPAAPATGGDRGTR